MGSGSSRTRAKRGIIRNVISKPKDARFTKRDLIDDLPERDQHLGELELEKMVNEGLMIFEDGYYRINTINRNLMIEIGINSCCEELKQRINEEVCIVCNDKNVPVDLYNMYGSFCVNCWQMVTYNR